MNKKLRFGDMLSGAGGTSTGAYTVPGLNVVWAINHDPVAIATHEANHPETVHFVDDIYNAKLATKLEPVDVLWASLECTQHSKAKGGSDKDVGSFMMGWEMLRYLKQLDPLIMIIENVPEFIKWGTIRKGKRVKGMEGSEYVKWTNALYKAGYTAQSYAMLNAADYGDATRRIRYIGYFAKPGVSVPMPVQTHHKEKSNLYGLPQWKPCKDYIDLSNEGNSIFGREFNENVAKGKRHPLSENTLKRIAGGVKKFAPDLYFIMKYFGNGNNCQSIDDPLHTIRTKDAMALIKVEKSQFIQDHCFTDNYDRLDEPMRTVLARETKQFISIQYNSNGKPESNNKSIDSPLPSPTTEEKFQFITTYFNIDSNDPALGHIDFDIKMRFLTPNELASIMGFPNKYFDHDGLKLSKKQKVKMIGNAVPVNLARAVLAPIAEKLTKLIAS